MRHPEYLRAMGELFAKRFSLEVHYTIDRMWMPLRDDALEFIEMMPLIHPEKTWKKNWRWNILT